MNPLGTRARAEELARLLDGAVAGPGVMTASYATLATRLRTLAPALDERSPMRPEFRVALRQRLIAVATVQAAAPYAEPVARPKALDAAVSWSQSRKAQRRLGVTAGAMAGIVAFTGVGIASSRSLPGQPFYGLKRAGEGVELQFASGDTAKGTKHLEFAETRLREVQSLTRGDNQLSLGAPGLSAAGLAAGLSDKISDTLADFDSETRAGRTLLENAYRASGKSEPLQILKRFSTTQQEALTALIPALPLANKLDGQQSLELVFSVGSGASELLALGTCGGECYPGNVGPSLPAVPTPTPGATADPTPSTDTNGVPDCACQPSPSPAPTPGSPAPTDEPTSEPTASPTPSSTPSPTPSSLLPTVVPTDLVPTIIPTVLPTLFPTLPPLPTGLPTLPIALPSLPANP